MNRFKIAVAFVLAALSGCRQESPTTAPQPSMAKADTTGGSLPERLEREAKTRPAAALRAEEVFAAIVTRGVEISERTQYLAAPVGASYCQNAKTLSDVSMTVCEFTSDAAAQEGRAKALAAVPVEHRQVAVHHATMLQLIEAPKGERSSAAAATALTAFNAL